MLSYPIDELVISNLTRILTFGHYEGIKRSLFVQDDTNSTRMTAVSPVFQDLASLGLDFSSSYDQGTRRHLLDKACTLWSNLETPRNASNGHCWVQPTFLLDLTAGTERGIWTFLASHEEPFRVGRVSNAIGIEQRILCKKPWLEEF
jgi:hypothetical protein